MPAGTPSFPLLDVSGAGGACDVARRQLGPVAPSALDERVVEHRLVIVLARDDDGLVPGARVDDPLVVDLGSEAFGVGRGERVTGAVHPSPSVAAADDR